MKNQLLLGAITLGTVCSGFSVFAQNADAFTLVSQLTGDTRQGNPSGLIVDVTIDVDDVLDIATWTVDINSPLHTDIKLDEFYFNLAGDTSGFTFNVTDPLNWVIRSSTPAAAAGSGNMQFIYEAADPAGPPNADDVTNTQDLVFTMAANADLSLTEWENLFLNAIKSVSNDTALAQGQMGAHLQSLTVDGQTCPQGGCSDSGFAVGDYTTTDIPTPAAVLPIIGGLFGAASRRKKGESTEA